MRTHLIAILSLGILCGAWIIFQEWIRRLDRTAPGIRRKCSDCDGSCETERGAATAGGRHH